MGQVLKSPWCMLQVVSRGLTDVKQTLLVTLMILNSSSVSGILFLTLILSKSKRCFLPMKSSFIFMNIDFEYYNNNTHYYNIRPFLRTNFSEGK